MDGLDFETYLFFEEVKDLDPAYESGRGLFIETGYDAQEAFLTYLGKYQRKHGKDKFPSWLTNAKNLLYIQLRGQGINVTGNQSIEGMNNSMSIPEAIREAVNEEEGSTDETNSD
jgi:hypothetical protein